MHPAYTTMDCAHCGARAKHCLPSPRERALDKEAAEADFRRDE